MAKRWFLISLLFIIITFGCYYKEETYQYVTIRKTNSNFYELNLKTLNKGRGNLHAMDFSKFEFNEHLWLYFKKLDGKIDADSLIWTKKRGKLYYPWKKKNIKGYILIDSSNKVKINLSHLIYNQRKMIEKWESFAKNGIYNVEFELDSISNVNLKNPY
ncbi:hypothetical protein [Psychroflexus sp. MES1-P1E]|uniref:hypothetical protein n=1 Tax=Psychroflexus sp. MES1-P1E TaxID=2058320 RepID=UPI000C7E691F|nr:hypothetical protein [Psychroflexus sp. MES1-P1E]PKG44062.1 hypothetical protein CXF67_01580 [Psychroflexus sp. MES1-P1E]